MKKIIFFAYDLNIGGIEKSLVNLLNRLVENYNVTLVLEKNEGTYKKDLSKKINIIEYEISNMKFIPLRKIINFTNRTLFILKHRNKYDFSCAFTPYLHTAVRLSRICSLNNYIYIHSDYSKIYKKKEFYEFFNTRYINDFKKIIFVSNESEKNFIKYYPSLKEKTLVINNIVNVKEIVNKSKEKLKIKLNKEDIIFSFVGRLEESSKRISRLLNTFKILIKKNKNIKLWLIGDGEYFNKTKDFISNNNLKDNIKMFGKQDNPYKYMKASNYIILTSDYEGFPVVFNEAIILEKIVFSTLNISDDYYNLTNGFGFLVPKDENLMAKNIEQIIKTNPKSKKIDYDMLNTERINKIINLIEKI